MTNEKRILAAEAAEAHSIFRWVAAIVLLAGGVVTAWKGGFAEDRADMPFWIWIFPVVFGLAGLSLLKKMSRTTLDRMRYGKVTLQIHGAVRPGGLLTGTIHLRPAGPIRRFKGTLSCEETVWYMETAKEVDAESESSLDNAHISLWDATRVLELDATGQLVVDFNLPPDLPVSCYPGDFGVSTEAELGRKYWRWQLRLRAEGASVDLRRTFVIPVEAAPIA